MKNREHTDSQIIVGVQTIRALRRAANNKTDESVTCITNRFRPKYYTSWSILLRRLGIVRTHESGFGLDKDYWNQSPKETDYDLCLRILNENDKYLAILKKIKKLKHQIDKPYIYFDHLSITKKEYDKLLNQHGSLKVDDIIDRIRNYKKNTKYKNLNLTIQNWIRTDLRNDIPNYWEDKQAKEDYNRLQDEIITIDKIVEDEPNNIKPEVKTKWLKIFGIKIYEVTLN